MHKITSTGDRLNILVSCDYSLHHDWMSFASWYSIYKNLPDAQVALLCARDLKDGYASFDWPYRCDIRFFQHENVGKRIGCIYANKLYATCVALKEGIVEPPLMVIDYDVIAANAFSKDIVNTINSRDVHFCVGGPVWYFDETGVERLPDALNTLRDVESLANQKWHYVRDLPSTITLVIESVLGQSGQIDGLCCEPSDLNPSTFIHCANECGHFNKKEWIAKRVHPPFAYAAELGKGKELTLNEHRVIL